jgi:hypothetical protein
MKHTICRRYTNLPIIFPCIEQVLVFEMLSMSRYAYRRIVHDINLFLVMFKFSSQSHSSGRSRKDLNVHEQLL